MYFRCAGRGVPKDGGGAFGASGCEGSDECTGEAAVSGGEDEDGDSGSPDSQAGYFVPG